MCALFLSDSMSIITTAECVIIVLFGTRQESISFLMTELRYKLFVYTFIYLLGIVARKQCSGGEKD